jgi:hypothetical protein
MSQDSERIIKDAQYRKGLSISFFNATNSAISLVASVPELRTDMKSVLDEVVRLRDIFIEEHKNYYANNIANIGLFKPADTVKRLQTVKNFEELRMEWIALSEDERQNVEVIKAKDDIKARYAEGT